MFRRWLPWLLVAVAAAPFVSLVPRRHPPRTAVLDKTEQLTWDDAAQQTAASIGTKTTTRGTAADGDDGDTNKVHGAYAKLASDVAVVHVENRTEMDNGRVSDRDDGVDEGARTAAAAVHVQAGATAVLRDSAVDEQPAFVNSTEDVPDMLKTRVCEPPIQVLAEGSSIQVHSSAALDDKDIKYAWVYRNGENPRVNYSHMACIERLPATSATGDRFIAAWQAARLIAGLPDQHVRLATSRDLVHWSPSRRAAISQAKAHGETHAAAIWAPVLYLARGMAATRAETGEYLPLFLFYAESTTCRRAVPLPPHAGGGEAMAYAPGGDIKFVRSADGISWTEPVTIHAQASDGGLPKVIANKPIQLRAGGSFVLPMWREHPGPGATCHVSKLAPTKSVASTRNSKPPKTAGKPAQINTRPAVLLSRGGERWDVSEDAFYSKAVPPMAHKSLEAGGLLLEGTAVELANGKVVQFFRSTAGFIYVSKSDDGGLSWSMPTPTSLPNPNSKVHAIVAKMNVLSTRDGNGREAIFLAYNHHTKLEDDMGGVRTNLFVAMSLDHGTTWSDIAYIETSKEPKWKYHYPTILALPEDCSIAVIYTVGNKEYASKGGVKIAFVDLARYATRANELPNLRKTTKDARKTFYLNFANKFPTNSENYNMKASRFNAQHNAPWADETEKQKNRYWSKVFNSQNRIRLGNTSQRKGVKSTIEHVT